MAKKKTLSKKRKEKKREPLNREGLEALRRKLQKKYH